MIKIGKCTKEIFIKDVKNHKLIVIKDDGAYKHIRITDGTFNLKYDLIAWPGYLCYTGDMGTYVFSRTADMFSFFRNDELKINPHYWSEKVVSHDRSGVFEYDNDAFINTIKDEMCGMNENEKQLVKEHFLNEQFDFEHEARQAIEDYNQNYGETFIDFFEHDLTDYTYRFIWCCYAIVWGIKKYDDL